MSTRGAVGFKVNGKYKAAYNHFDSYPYGLGEDVVEFARYLSKNNLVEQCRRNAANMSMVDENATPTQVQKEKLLPFADLQVGRRSEDDFYCLFRNLQGSKILYEIAKGTIDCMLDGTNFLKDSLFCEYAYIINLDDETIQFFKGFQKSLDPNTPFSDEFVNVGNSEYKPVALVGECSLHDIPQDWSIKFYS